MEGLKTGTYRLYSFFWTIQLILAPKLINTCLNFSPILVVNEIKKSEFQHLYKKNAYFKRSLL